MALNFILPRNFKDFFSGFATLIILCYLFPKDGIFLGIIACLAVWHYFNNDEASARLQTLYERTLLGKKK